MILLWRPLFSAAILCEETLAASDRAGQHSRSATAEKEIQRSSVQSPDTVGIDRLAVASRGPLRKHIHL
jgi:hypothetical protein